MTITSDLAIRVTLTFATPHMKLITCRSLLKVSFNRLASVCSLSVLVSIPRPNGHLGPLFFEKPVAFCES